MCSGDSITTHSGIAILAPIVHRVRVEDEDGDQHTITGSPRAFRVLHVFALEQTDGDELPEIPCHGLNGDGVSHDELIRNAANLGFTVTADELPGQMNGLCSHTKHQITLRSGLETAQRTKTLAHEIAHALLHGPAFEGTRDQAEFEAESVAYIVCGALDIDSADYS